METRPLVLAWGALLALSAATALLTLAPQAVPPAAIAGIVLLLAGLKARLILAHYLALSSSSFWMGGFGLAIGLFLLIAFGLYLMASGS
jgi:hypothetical protein